MATYRYQKKHQPPVEGEKDPLGRYYYPYIPDPDLIEVVNLAIALERPLLLEGEPGCGKTRLASAVTYQFTCEYLKQKPKNIKTWWPFYIWNIKSTSRARDGLYRYDAVRRLRDAQLVGSDLDRLADYLGPEESEKLKQDLKDRTNYREFGPLGEALRPGQNHRPVVLIDEIDKADSDFPNDLLLELEELRFDIPETGERIPTPEHKPIIFITSNREKPLPDPFLRRCLYYFVEFPTPQRLQEILERRFGNQLDDKDEVVAEAIDRFYELRESLEGRPGSRPPGTSEFLEFVAALLQRSSAKKALEDLEFLAERLPLLSTLLKTRSDQLLYQDLSGKEEGDEP